jgi:hypothetical protein
MNIIKSLLGSFILLTAAGCENKNEKEDLIQQSAEPRQVLIDTAWTEKFMPDTVGFSGADGVYSQLLPDGRTVWIFGDTFIGNLSEGNTRIKTNPLYIRNSFVVFEEDQRQTLQQGKPEEFKSMMIPPEVADGSAGKTELELWYWPGDAFIENGNLNVFLSKFSQIGEGMWDFQFEGTEMFTFSLPDFEIQEVEQFDELNEIHFGHAVCETDSFTYIYGLKEKFPYVARAPHGQVTGEWEFYTGELWCKESMEAKPVLEFSGSEQFSVFTHNDKFIMIMQEGELSNRIFSFTADNPEGPWENKQLIYEIPLPAENKNLFTYNALGHPQFIKDNMLLVSYNTNSFELDDHFKDALIYRPRFIRVPMELILKD